MLLNIGNKEVIKNSVSENLGFIFSNGIKRRLVSFSLAALEQLKQALIVSFPLF